MRKFRTLDEFTEEYFRAHPDEIDDYLTEIFQEYAEDNDTGALLASLRVIARVRGVSDLAERTGMTRRGYCQNFSKREGLVAVCDHRTSQGERLSAQG